MTPKVCVCVCVQRWSGVQGDSGNYRSVPLSSAQYLRRRRSALWVTVSLLALSLVILTVGLISATRTDNVPVAGYYPGIIVSLPAAWFRAFSSLSGCFSKAPSGVFLACS